MSIKKLNTILICIEDGIAGGILGAVLFIVVWELTLRGVFGRSHLSTDELSRVLLIALVYIAAIGLTRDGPMSGSSFP